MLRTLERSNAKRRVKHQRPHHAAPHPDLSQPEHPEVVTTAPVAPPVDLEAIAAADRRRQARRP